MTESKIQTRAAESHAGSIVTDEKREDFIQRGFFTLPEIASPDEVPLIKAELMRLMQARAGIAEGALLDLVSPDGEPSVSPAMFNPSNYSALLRRTKHRERCLEVARAILGPDAKQSFEQMIYKPEGVGAATPWHQDDAFINNPDYEIPQISIWMPLQDVNEENGCMRYVAGSHLGPLLMHSTPGGDPDARLEAVLDGTPNATYVPLPAGGAVIHHSRTLHGAGENRSGRERLAYVLAFDGTPKRRETPITHPWHQVGIVAELGLRRRRWLAKGGVFVLAWRKLRNGRISDLRRFGYEVDRIVRRWVSGRKA